MRWVALRAPTLARDSRPLHAALALNFIFPFFPACVRSEEAAPVPPEILAAVEAGNVEEVSKLLAKAPESMSKNEKKKLEKTAQINAKKLAKGGAVKPAAEKPAAAGGAAPASPPTAPMKAMSIKPTGPPPVSSEEGVAGAAEMELVAAMLGRAESLSLPAEALATLRENMAALALAVSPAVNALRNDAYTTGFTAHGSR